MNEILSTGLVDLIDIHLANIFMGKMSFFFMRKERNFDDFFGDSFGAKLRIVIVIRQMVKGFTHPLPYHDDYIFVAMFFFVIGSRRPPYKCEYFWIMVAITVADSNRQRINKFL